MVVLVRLSVIALLAGCAAQPTKPPAPTSVQVQPVRDVCAEVPLPPPPAPITPLSPEQFEVYTSLPDLFREKMETDLANYYRLYNAIEQWNLTCRQINERSGMQDGILQLRTEEVL